MTNGEELSKRRGTVKLPKEQEQLLKLSNVIYNAESLEAVLLRLRSEAPDAARELSETAGVYLSELRRWLVKALLDEPLADELKWERMARDPLKFSAALERVITAFAGAFRTAYGIPSHRRTTETDRDRRIWEMRKRGKAFGQIAQRLAPMTRNAAERACKRHELRMRKQTEEFLEMLRDSLKETGFFNKPASQHTIM